MAPVNSTDRTLFRARMIVAREHLDALMEVLAVLEPSPTSWEDMESGEAWVEAYDADREALATRARDMADLASGVDGRIHAAEITVLEAADWTEAWKQFFHTTRVSRRIVVHPSWEPFDPQTDDVVVDIDPGMSFGTGLHPTTRACLHFLDGLHAAGQGADTATVVDLGCGSGILAIAAAKLGFAAIVALDNDPLAVRVSQENIALNHLPAARIRCATGDVLCGPLPEGDVVVANILAPVLVEAAPRIAKAVRPGHGATLILAGILDSQFADVEAAYCQMGFACVDSFLDSGWRSGCFRRSECGATP